MSSWSTTTWSDWDKSNAQGRARNSKTRGQRIHNGQEWDVEANAAAKAAAAANSAAEQKIKEEHNFRKQWGDVINNNIININASGAPAVGIGAGSPTNASAAGVGVAGVAGNDEFLKKFGITQEKKNVSKKDLEEEDKQNSKETTEADGN